VLDELHDFPVELDDFPAEPDDFPAEPDPSEDFPPELGALHEAGEPPVPGFSVFPVVFPVVVLLVLPELGPLHEAGGAGAAGVFPDQLAFGLGLPGFAVGHAPGAGVLVAFAFGFLGLGAAGFGPLQPEDLGLAPPFPPPLGAQPKSS